MPGYSILDEGNDYGVNRKRFLSIYDIRNYDIPLFCRGT